MQNPKQIIVMPPAAFGGNPETAENNHFQKTIGNHTAVGQQAEIEHQNFCEQLMEAEIETLVLEDDITLHNTDAVFLNNWFCILPDKTLIVFPMWAVSRRKEIRFEIILQLETHFSIRRTLNFSHYTEKDEFCEGTGSIIFDHEKRLAFAAVSPRTTVGVFEQICKEIGYTPISFEANDARGNEIYHTNVLLSIGKNVVVICSDTIINPIEKAMVMNYLNHSNKLIIDISFAQLDQFCANVFEVENKNGKTYLLMSSTAYSAFTEEQRANITARINILHSSIPTIEEAGGGSVRCMIAAGF